MTDRHGTAAGQWRAWLAAVVLGCGPAQAFGPGLSGAWWNPARSGEGQMLSFEQQGGTHYAVLGWMSYDSDGAPLWLTGSTPYTPQQQRLSIALVRASGPRFGDSFDPRDVVRQPAGTAEIEYLHCNALRLRYRGEQTFSLRLERMFPPPDCQPAAPGASALDLALRAELLRHGLEGDPAQGRAVPGPDAPLAHLGKLLFFSKTLGSGLDVACASCHHPALGGGDALAVSIGLDATLPDLLGPGRSTADGRALVGRNAPTFFNTVLLDRSLFWDGRVESLVAAPGSNGAGGGIRTPESPSGLADPLAGPNLLAAQARFPVVGATEMRDPSVAALDDAALRAHLAARIGDYGSGAGALGSTGWRQAFRAAFGDGPAETLVSFDNITRALAEYQRSALFVDSPFTRYLQGDDAALGEAAKRGALLFFRRAAEGGAQCAQCHAGDRFTDEEFHVVGFPQVGPGAGAPDRDDHGREQASGDTDDRYRFRTPSLLNVALTAPYGHDGAYADLRAVVEHYLAPDARATEYVAARAWCGMEPFAADPDCASHAAQAEANTAAALARLAGERSARPFAALPVLDAAQLPATAVDDLVAFLESLTDPCLLARACIARWIPAPGEAPDAHQLDAVDGSGRPL